MSRVRGKVFSSGSTEDTMERLNEFLERKDVGYVGVQEISEHRFLLMYSKKEKKSNEKNG